MQSYHDGIVTAVKKSPDPRNNIYTVLSKKAVFAKSRTLLEINDRVDIELEDGVITSERVTGKAPEKDVGAALKRLVGELEIGKNIRKVVQHCKGTQYAHAVSGMADALEKAAAKFMGAYISGAPIIVRFHHDGDGSSGAVSLHRALSDASSRLLDGQRSISWIMHRGVEYDVDSFYADSLELKNYESAHAPVILITDFGTAPGSERQIAETTKSSTLIMLDHHPLYTGFPKGRVVYINPWDYGSDTNFTAGLLTSIFADSISNVKTEDMKAASLISDFSSFADRSDREAMKNAVILDYLTNVAGRAESGIAKLTPSYIESVIASREKSDEVFYTASNMMNEMLDLGVKNVKSYKCSRGITAFVLEFEALPKSNTGYPLPGRYSSRLQERLESVNGENTITVLYYGSYVTLRLSKSISREVGILKVIDEIVGSSDYVESGGGHNEAASIRVNRDHTKEIVSMVLRRLGASP